MNQKNSIIAFLKSVKIKLKQNDITQENAIIHNDNYQLKISE